MKVVFVKGDWLSQMVQPNLILKYIHREGLGVVSTYEEDADYNITMYISKCAENCIEKLKDNFPQYNFIPKED